MLRSPLLMLALAWSPLAFAAGAIPCGDAGGQQDMNACIAKKLEGSDAALNTTYADLAGKLDVNGKRNLVAAERAWIAFRDSECNLRSGTDTVHPENNGTVMPFLQGLCLLDLTKRRISDLQAELRCPGGDLSCAP